MWPSGFGTVASALVRVLILGGTGESRELAKLLVDRGVAVTSSLAGRVSNPALPVGDVRVGGFGGAQGLGDYLRESSVDVLIDATHPFAATISAHAAQAADETRTRLIAVRRPAWQAARGDNWQRVETINDAAAVVRARPQGTVLLTTGRRDLAAFAEDEAHDYLVRTVEPPLPPTPPRMTLVLDRGPYTLDGELALMRSHNVRVLVTKDSGGDLTSAKLAAARELGMPVVMVDRPALPSGVTAVEDVATVLTLLSDGSQ